MSCGLHLTVTAVSAVGIAATGTPVVAAVEAVATGLDIATAQTVAAGYMVGECNRCIKADVFVDTAVGTDGMHMIRLGIKLFLKVDMLCLPKFLLVKKAAEFVAEDFGVAFAVADVVDNDADVVAEATGAAHDEVAVVSEPVADFPDCSAGSHVGTSGSLAPRLRWRGPFCTDSSRHLVWGHFHFGLSLLRNLPLLVHHLMEVDSTYLISLILSSCKG